MIFIFRNRIAFRAPRLPGAAAALILGAIGSVAASAQVHPPEVRAVYPVGGSAGRTTRVSIFGTSFRNARRIVFDRPGIAAKIVAPDFSKLPPPTIDNDNAPGIIADFTVDRDANHDVYAFRVISDYGVSSPGRWLVGRDLPAVEEKEPNNGIAQAQPVETPIAVNGRIADAGDVDAYAVHIDSGKPFVAEVVAARAGSPLDSLLILYDDAGTEVANNDDFGGPDSTLVYRATRSGRYFLTIRSSIAAGSPGHVYRLCLGAMPLLMGTLPITIARGAATTVKTVGVNVPAEFSVTVPREWRHGFYTVHTPDGMGSNGVKIGVSDLPLSEADGSNIDMKHARTLAVPGAVNGRFYREGAADPVPAYYRFHVDAGRRLLIDVQCQDRSGERCDPMLTLFDSSGGIVQEGDDARARDAHIDRAFDKTGDYVLRVRNLAETSSPDLVYQLLIRDPGPPGFSLSADTGMRAVPRGGTIAFDVRVSRDRWSGPVTLSAGDLPPGVTATTEVVPDEVNHGLVVMIAAADAPLAGFALHLTGIGIVGGKSETRIVGAATDRIWNGGDMRVEAAPEDAPYCAVALPVETAPIVDAARIDLAAGKAIKVHAKVERRAGFAKAVTLTAVGLPDGVSATAAPVPAGTMEADLELKAMPNARPGDYVIVLDAISPLSAQVLLDRESRAVILRILPAGAGSRTRNPALQTAVRTRNRRAQ